MTVINTIFMVVFQLFLLIIFIGFLYSIARKFFAMLVDIEIERRLEELNDKDNFVYKLKKANDTLEEQIKRYDKLMEGR